MGPPGPEGHRGPSGQSVRILNHFRGNWVVKCDNPSADLQHDFFFALG